MVLIISSVVQHSHKLAESLFSAGLLQHYVCGSAVAGTNSSGIRKNKQHPSIKNIAVPEKLISNLYFVRLFIYIANLININYLNYIVAHFSYWLFDIVSIFYLLFRRPKIVVCYENGALLCFVFSKILGIRCVLDAASIHYCDMPKYGAKNYFIITKIINIRKHFEILLADNILVCSRMAYSSFLKCGVKKNKLILNNIAGGWPPFLTSKYMNADCTSRNRNEVRFLFVGAVRLIKGIDMLSEAICMLARDRVNFHVGIAGGIQDEAIIKSIKNMPNVTFYGNVEESALIKIYSTHDCLILPSRFESFGMVVPEALSLGLPVIVSNCAGASDLIKENPECGWIINPNTTDLYDIMKNICISQSKLLVAKQKVKSISHLMGWDNYMLRTAEIFNGFLNELGRK